MEKSLRQIKAQEHRIEMMMLNKNFNPKNPKRYKRWCKIADAINNNLLAYYGVNHLWEDNAYNNRYEPIPYEARIVH